MTSLPRGGSAPAANSAAYAYQSRRLSRRLPHLTRPGQSLGLCHIRFSQNRHVGDPILLSVFILDAESGIQGDGFDVVFKTEVFGR